MGFSCQNFCLTITGGVGTNEPYGSPYSSTIDYYWNYYYKTITIRTDTPLTISGTGEYNANIIVNNSGWSYLTFDNLTLNEDGGCVILNPNSRPDLTLVGTNTLTANQYTEYGVVKKSPAISLNNSNTYLWINKNSTGSLTATSNCEGMSGIGTSNETDTVYGFTMKGGTVTAKRPCKFKKSRS